MSSTDRDWNKNKYNGDSRDLWAFRQWLNQEAKAMDGEFLVEIDLTPPVLSQIVQGKLAAGQLLIGDEKFEHREYIKTLKDRNTIANRFMGTIKNATTSTLNANFRAVEQLPVAAANATRKVAMMLEVLETRCRGDRAMQTKIVEQIEDEIRAVTKEAKSDADAEAKLNTLLGYETELTYFAGGASQMSVQSIQNKVISILRSENYATVRHKLTDDELTTVGEVLKEFLSEASRLRGYLGSAKGQQVSFASAPSTPSTAAVLGPSTTPASSQGTSVGAASASTEDFATMKMELLGEMRQMLSSSSRQRDRSWNRDDDRKEGPRGGGAENHGGRDRGRYEDRGRQDRERSQERNWNRPDDRFGSRNRDRGGYQDRDRVRDRSRDRRGKSPGRPTDEERYNPHDRHRESRGRSPSPYYPDTGRGGRSWLRSKAVIPNRN